MSLTARALFVIERNLGETLPLDAVAAACGVSRFHLAHAFVAATGRTVTDYIRARRLANAARRLAEGAPSILDVAIAAGYASHEAFSRAFRAQFGMTAETLRDRRSLEGIALQEVLTMGTHQLPIALAPPTFRRAGEQLFVGLAADSRMGESAKIPGQWQDFMSGPYQRIRHRLEQRPVGISVPGKTEDSFIYVCAAQVSRFEATPAGLTELTIAPSEYAIFAHDGHVSGLPLTYQAIWNDWLPVSGRTPQRAASLEHHNASFDPRTGSGGVTVWIPLAAAANSATPL